MDLEVAVWITVAAALIFDVINGFHDAANSIATVVSTRVLSPRVAVMWAAVWNFVAYFVFTTAVAKTVSGIVKIDQGDQAYVFVVMAGLAGAIFWDLLTWYWGLPTSSSHALIGGLCGAGLLHGGWGVLVKAKLYKTLIFIVFAPLIGFVLGFLIMLVVYWLFRRARPGTIDRWFRVGQLFSAAAYSVGHGGNDAQKTMGVIIAVMIAGGTMSPGFTHIPLWIPLSCFAAMAFGTAMGGWRIVKTMGMKITQLKPVGGFCAETAGALTLFGATTFAVPVSTTHTITGAIIGVGSTTKLRGIKWGVATRIVWAWVLTIPMSALVGGLAFMTMHWLRLW